MLREETCFYYNRKGGCSESCLQFFRIKVVLNGYWENQRFTIKHVVRTLQNPHRCWQHHAIHVGDGILTKTFGSWPRVSTLVLSMQIVLDGEFQMVCIACTNLVHVFLPYFISKVVIEFFDISSLQNNYVTVVTVLTFALFLTN